MIRNPGDYPTEATSGAGQRHHQVVAVDEVIDRVMSPGTVSARRDLVKSRQPPSLLTTHPIHPGEHRFDIGGGNRRVEDHRVQIATLTRLLVPTGDPASVGMWPDHPACAIDEDLAFLGRPIDRGQSPPNQGHGDGPVLPSQEVGLAASH